MKLKSFSCLMFYACLAILSCKEVPLSEKENVNIYFDVEEQKTIKLDDISASKFLFSPIDSNAIWFFDNGKVKQFDLKTGKSDRGIPVPSDKIFGAKIMIDEVNQIAWFFNWNSGLYKFDLASRTGQSINTRYAKSIFFTTQNLIAFGYRNYHRLDLEGNFIDKKSIPIDGGIKSVCMIDETTFLLNDELTFSTKNDSLFIDNGVRCLKDENLIPNYYKSMLIQKFPISDSRYQLIKEGDKYWGFNEKAIYLYQNQDTLLGYSEFEQLRDFKMDEKYLYLLTNRGFSILNKKYALENLFKKVDVRSLNSIQGAKKEYADFRKEYWSNFDWINKERNLDSFLLKDSLLREKYLKSDNQKILDDLKSSRLGLNFWNSDELIVVVEKGILENKIPDYYLYSAFEGVIQNKVKKGRFEAGRKWGEKWNDLKKDKKVFSDLEYFDKQVLRLTQFVKDLNELKNKNLPVDIELKNEIDLTEKFVESNNWFEAELSYDKTLVVLLVDSFLVTYPLSSMIEEVSYTKMKLDLWIGGCTPSFIPENIAIYKKFISDFPESKYAPQVICQMLSEYEYFSGGEPQSVVDTIKHVRKELENFFNLHPSYRNTYSYVARILQKKELTATWDFSIKSDEKVFSASEPIEIFVSIKNKTKEPQILEFFSDEGYPNISLNGSREIFQNNKKSDSIQIKKVIAPGEVYSEKIDLRKRIRHRDGLGTFDLESPNRIHLGIDYRIDDRTIKVARGFEIKVIP